MSDELIRKLDVIEIMENLIYDMSEVSTIPQLAKSAIEKLEPVNAVELPCKVGDTIYELCKVCNAIHEYEVVGFRYEYEMVFIECDLQEFTDEDIGVRVFLTREEAEKALEELENG